MSSAVSQFNLGFDFNSDIDSRVKTDSSRSLKSLSDDQLTDSFSVVAARERQATSDLIDHIREFEARRLYLKYGCTSIFGYMTAHLHYCGSTAQSRIDAARLIGFVPSLQDDLLSGEIKISQVKILSESLRQKAKESPDHEPTPGEKRDLIDKIKGCDGRDTAIILARELDIALRAVEKLRHQQDGSVVIELTLSKEEMELLAQVKSLISHTIHDAKWSEVIVAAAKYFVERKDPGAERRAKKASERKTTAGDKAEISQQRDIVRKSFDVAKVNNGSETTADRQWNTFAEKDNYQDRDDQDSNRSDLNTNEQNPIVTFLRQPIPAATRRFIFQRDRTCQWKHESGEKCQSMFQLQVDHIVSVCDGGGNEIENLQLLCSGHNRMKYRMRFDVKSTARRK